MRTLWIASAVLLIGALVSVMQHRAETALLFAGIAFERVFIVESNFAWEQRIQRGNWRQSVFESSAQTTVLGKLAQVLAFVCLAGFFLVARH